MYSTKDSTQIRIMVHGYAAGTTLRDIENSVIMFLTVGAHPCDRPVFNHAGTLDRSNTRFAPTVNGISRISKIF